MRKVAGLDGFLVLSRRAHMDLGTLQGTADYPLLMAAMRFSICKKINCHISHHYGIHTGTVESTI